MKITIFILFAAIMQVSASSFAQKINISENSITLKKLFKEIRKQSGYNFVYTEGMLKNTQPVSVHVIGATINETLDNVLYDQPLRYTITNNTVVLQEKQPTAKIAADPVNITGQVLDDKNVPLPGVTVRLKNSTAATITDVNGKFSITVADNNAVLVFSFVGFTRKELPASIGMIVKLTPEVSDLNDVVVVGYGTQRKVDLTGSVSSVSGTILNERSTPNAANLLEGRVAGLDLVQTTGQPGQDAPNFATRGLGSFGAGAAPLILVDGVIVADLNLVAGNDIESVSVLKDAASAAIYGNRAANGVILVTTKRGKSGTTTINYNNDFSLDQPSRMPDLIWNSVEYMNDFNQARIHSGQTPVYSAAQIALYANAPAGSKEYPNFNYEKYYIGNSFQQNHHISVNGGNENTQYNIAAGYLQQNGIIKSTDANRYNLLMSLDAKVNKTFKAGGTVSLSRQDITEPWLSNDNLVLLIYQSAPTYEPFLPDGSGRYSNNDFYNPSPDPVTKIQYGAGHNRSPEYTLDNGGVITNNYEVRTQVYLETKITSDLTWLIKGAINYNDSFQSTHEYAGAEYYYHPDANGNYVETDNGGPPSIGVQNYDQREFYSTAYTTLDYTKTFATNHHLHVLAGASAESDTYQNLYGQRSQFPATNLTQLNAGSVTGQNLRGDETQYALQSLFGRINYDYKDKYLLELNGRDDGTSRIAPAKRFGFFPSASVGWRISQEDFMKSSSWIDELKLRASYGRLGNQNIGNYPYQALLSTTQYAYNSSTGVSPGVYQPSLNNPNLQWETTDVADLGLDLNIKHGLFTATIDYYNKKTSGILYNPQVLLASGLYSPTENSGTVQNRGFEIDLGHSYHIGKDFRYSVEGIFALNRNKVLQLTGGTEDDGMFINKVGEPFGSFYLYKWTGIYQSQAQISSGPTLPYNPKPGDLTYADLNGDGKINASDREIVSGQFPSYTYSFKLNLSYKNFDLTTFFQGVQGIKHWVYAWGYDPFIQGSTPPTFFRNAWTPENHSETVPALYTFGYQGVDQLSSTYFLKDASYLRLKNIRLTYHLPIALAKKMLIKNAAVFISSDNLFTFTKYPGDPERLQYGPYNQQTNTTGQTAPGSEYASSNRYAQYPQVRMFTAGLNVSL